MDAIGSSDYGGLFLQLRETTDGKKYSQIVKNVIRKVCRMESSGEQMRRGTER